MLHCCRLVSFAVSIIVGCVLACQAARASDDSNTDRFLRFLNEEYSDAADRWRDRSDNLRCRVVFSEASFEKTPFVRTLYVLGPDRAEHREYLVSSPRNGVYGKGICSTPEMFFILVKNAPNAGFVIANFQENPTGDGPKRQTRMTIDNYIWSPFALTGIPLIELMQSDGFAVTSFDEGGDRARVSFTLKDSPTQLTAGEVELDRAVDWGIVSFSNVTLKQGEYSQVYGGILEYDSSAKGGPAPTHLVITETVRPRPNKEVIFCDVMFEKYERDVAQPSDFTLAAFGVSELRADSSGLRLLLVVGSLLILAVLVFSFSGRLRRRARGSP